MATGSSRGRGRPAPLHPGSKPGAPARSGKPAKKRTLPSGRPAPNRTGGRY